jgi:hypothetical protein
MTAVENVPTRSWLGIVVGPDVMACLDLVLDEVGVDYHRLRIREGGARVIIDLADRADGLRIVDALRQHLGGELREATIYHDGDRTRVVYNPADAKAASARIEPDDLRIAWALKNLEGRQPDLRAALTDRAAPR